MMTLEEAIKHAEKVAEEKFNNAVYIMDKMKSAVALENAEECKRCADEHRQLAEWLTELAERRKAELQWIPCSERMPEEDDYKYCIECLDGAIWYFTENGTMGLGYYYKSTKEWSTTDDLKTDGKVVAWMPLPKPYKEGD